MNADEIVGRLREYAKRCDGIHGCWNAPTLLAAADIIEALQCQLAEAQRRERAAVEELTQLLKHPDADICAHCKNMIKCEGKDCEHFYEGYGGMIDGKMYPSFKFSCMDYEYGTCEMLENTVCNGCFDNDYRGFEWREPQEDGKGDKA